MPQFNPPNVTPQKSKAQALLEPIGGAIQSLPILWQQHKLEKRKLDSEQFKQDMDIFNAQLNALKAAQGITQIDPITKQPTTYAGIEGLNNPGAIEKTPSGAFRLNWDIVSPGVKKVENTGGAGKTKQPIYLDKKAMKFYDATTREEMPAPADLSNYQVFEKPESEVANVRKENQLLSMVDKFNADPMVRKHQMATDFSLEVTQLAESGNPIAAAAIPTYMARASGEVGNLSEADKKPFGGSRAVLQRFEASLKQMASGQLTEDNRQFIVGLGEIMRKNAASNIDKLAHLRAKQYSKTGFYKEDELYNTFNPEGGLSQWGGLQGTDTGVQQIPASQTGKFKILSVE